MKIKLASALIAGSLVTVACQKAPETNQDSSAPVVSKEDAVASVNGIYISKTHLDSLKQEIAQNPRAAKMTDQQLLDRLIQSELLVQVAKKSKLDQNPDFITRMELMKNAILSQSAVQAYIAANPATDEELKVEYDKQFGGANEEEYKARHILLKTEDEAKAVIVELDKGGDFVALAKEKSTGPSGPNGGDLGWFESKRMVPEFSQAVIALENGKYTAEPVKTQFGWHIILREESRKKTPPAFDQVKEQFKPMLRNTKITTYLDGLRNNAQVEILLAEEVKAEPAPESIEIKKIEENPTETASETPEEAKPAEEKPAE